MNGLSRHFGQAVRCARQSLSLSQEGLAEKADLNRSYVGEIERGDVVPSLLTMTKLALALNLKPSELVARYEENAMI